MSRWMIALALAVAGLAGCPPSAQVDTPRDTRPPRVVNGEQLCHRMFELHDQHCGLFTNIAKTKTCPQEVTGALSDPQSRVNTEATDECVNELANCADIIACLGQIESTNETRSCDDRSELRMLDAVGEPHALWRANMKHDFTKLSQVTSTKDTPVELCGRRAMMWWLTALACDDGSRPLGSDGDAEKARVGNVGQGGPCGAVIDHFQVTCPERAYDVYLDPALCPLPHAAQ